MKCFLIFVSSLLSVHSYRVPYIGSSVSSASSEEILRYPSRTLRISASVSSASSEEVRFYPQGPAFGAPQLPLTGLGVVSQPILQAVAAPRYANDLDSRRLLVQALAPQDLQDSDFGNIGGNVGLQRPAVQDPSVVQQSPPTWQLYGGYGYLSPKNVESNLAAKADAQLQPVSKVFDGYYKSQAPNKNEIDAQRQDIPDLTDTIQSPPVLQLFDGQSPKNVDYNKYQIL